MANEQRGGSGNFANDPERASEAGKKGGERSHGGSSQHQQGGPSSGQRGGAGNFANDRERASEAGRKGGQSQILIVQTSGVNESPGFATGAFYFHALIAKDLSAFGL